MRHDVALTVGCAEWDGAQVFRRLTAYELLAAHTPVVKRVVQDMDEVNGPISHWDVLFRSGRLCWTQRDRFDDVEWTAEFEAVSGDPKEFKGAWKVDDDPAGCIITFEATIELGIASFEEVLDPIAADTVVENVTSILKGTFAGAHVLDRRARQVTVPLDELRHET